MMYIKYMYLNVRRNCETQVSMGIMDRFQSYEGEKHTILQTSKKCLSCVLQCSNSDVTIKGLCVLYGLFYKYMMCQNHALIFRQ